MVGLGCFFCSTLFQSGKQRATFGQQKVCAGGTSWPGDLASRRGLRRLVTRQQKQMRSVRAQVPQNSCVCLLRLCLRKPT